MLTVSDSLQKFFNPKSIAILGASRTPGKIGHEILRNIKLGGYSGQVYPINPNARSILGFHAFPSIGVVPNSVDLAVVVLPASLTVNAIKECGEKGVHSAIVITSGFSETGNVDLERELIATARRFAIRIVGPNTFGIFFAKSRLNATFGPNYVLAGKTAFISQSGALGLALMDWTTEEKYGVSSIVSIGNKADVDDADLVEFFESDESTGSILIYMEGLKNGRSFYKVCRRVSKSKPVIVIKAGSSSRGAQAASSHTGSIAGQDAVFSAAFEQAGIMRAESMTQAFDWIQAMNENPLPKAGGVVLLTNGGGVGVLATDACEALGINLPDLSENLKNEITHLVPSYGSVRNPIDMTANADEDTYGSIVTKLLKSQEVDAIIALFCQTANIDPMLVAEAIIQAKRKALEPKPMTAALIGGHVTQQAYARMLEKKFAAYPTGERAVDGMYALLMRKRQLERPRKEMLS